MDSSDSCLGLVAVHFENLAKLSSRVGRVRPGLEVWGIGSEVGSDKDLEIGSEMGSKEVGRFSKGSKVGAESGCIGSEVSGKNLVCSDSVVACSCTRVGEVGSGTSECSMLEDRS